MDKPKTTNGRKKKVARKSPDGFAMVQTSKGGWTNCTPQLSDRVCNNLKDGAPLRAALGALGLKKGTFDGWLRNAEVDEAEGLDAESSPFIAFRDKVMTAFSQAEVCLLAEIRAASSNKSQWQNLAWILERTRFSDYGLKQEVKIDVNMPGPQLPPNPPTTHDEWVKRVKEREKMQKDAVDATFKEIYPNEN